MARRKLKHFAEMKTWEHVFEPTSDAVPKLAGTWGRPVILELGCGYGDITLFLAERFPDRTFVGVDVKGSRLWHGARQALVCGLKNARFLRIRIEDLADYFAEEEVDEIWIPFPDPHPTLGNVKRRLTSPRFLEIYKRILKPGGLLHLKTDNEGLFHYTLNILTGEGFTVEEVVEDVYGGGEFDRHAFGAQTLYEKKYVKEGRTIRYLRAEKV